MPTQASLQKARECWRKIPATYAQTLAALIDEICADTVFVLEVNRQLLEQRVPSTKTICPTCKPRPKIDIASSKLDCVGTESGKVSLPTKEG